MELKQIKGSGNTVRQVVLIVPLWNWNYKEVENRTALKSSNRTFMELKRKFASVRNVSISVLIVPLWNWNVCRYYFFVEVFPVLIVPLWNWNLQMVHIVVTLLLVLIVPLWNWNVDDADRGYFGNGSNRTFMELKRVVAAVTLVVLKSSNRTFMELKHLHSTLSRQHPRF